MAKLCALSVLALLAATSAAQPQSVISVVSPDHKTITTTTSRGTATIKITRNGDTVTAVATFKPSNPGYQPMGGSYRPTGDTYKPMGR